MALRTAKQGNKKPVSDGGGRALYDIGCAGRISEFSESDDGRLLITLSGTARFRYHGDMLAQSGYLVGDVDFAAYQDDLQPDAQAIDRARLTDILKSYFEVKGFSADWDHIEECEDERLVTTLSMICPLAVSEKQALLESPDLSHRTELLIAMLEMSVHTPAQAGNAPH